MNEKRQTAIEWLFDNLNLCFDKFDNGEYSYTEFVNASNEIKEEAKIIEKEQIIFAYNQGYRDGEYDSSNIPLSIGDISEFNNAKQYYNNNYE